MPVGETQELLHRLTIARRQKGREHGAIRNANAKRQLAH
jgi:hypothetical protein